MSSALHFDLARSVDYHPLGIFILLALVTLAISPESRLRSIKNNLESDQLFRGIATVLFISVFIAIWLVRMFYNVSLK